MFLLGSLVRKWVSRYNGHVSSSTKNHHTISENCCFCLQMVDTRGKRALYPQVKNPDNLSGKRYLRHKAKRTISKVSHSLRGCPTEHMWPISRFGAVLDEDRAMMYPINTFVNVRSHSPSINIDTRHNSGKPPCNEVPER